VQRTDNKLHLHCKEEKSWSFILECDGLLKITSSYLKLAMSFWTLSRIIFLSILLRLVFLLYGLYQDAHSAVKYTDIDYLVFTDAARAVSKGSSPYDRETYRYTPLLAWILLPTTWPGQAWFAFGKVLFAAADIAAGYLLYAILCSSSLSPQGKGTHANSSMAPDTALRYASVWLLNPMVATISTRGSSEGLLGLLVVALLWATLQRRPILAGILLGLGVHVKIYPFIYAPSLLLYFETKDTKASTLLDRIHTFVNKDRILLTTYSALTFIGLNVAMYIIYGSEFIQHTFSYHLTRLDHRHNFSPYNILLYASSANSSTGDHSPRFGIESIAFLPQLSLAAVLIPLALAKKHLPSALLAQTLAFVALNKVCTSQYFLWYLVLLPLYLPHSQWLNPPALTNPNEKKNITTVQQSFISKYHSGLLALALWIAGQAVWLQQGYELEFLGKSTFVPGLWLATLTFYIVNMWILGTVVTDASSILQT
jgi:GPI mannosyltransferase 1 subunit M